MAPNSQSLCLIVRISARSVVLGFFVATTREGHEHSSQEPYLTAFETTLY